MFPCSSPSSHFSYGEGLVNFQSDAIKTNKYETKTLLSSLSLLSTLEDNSQMQYD